MKAIVKELYKNSRFNTQEILEMIFDSFSEDGNAKYRITLKIDVPISILEKLSRDEHWFVRCGVAQHTSTPIYTLINLNNDSIANVHYWASQNPIYSKYKNNLKAI